MKYLNLILVLIFSFTQTVALADNTKSALQVATFANLQSEEQMAYFIDQNLDQINDAEIKEDHSESLSASGLRKEARWNKKLVALLPKLNEKIAKSFQDVNDAELDANIAALKTEATHAGDLEQLTSLEKISALPTEQKRVELTTHAQTGAANLIPTIAHEIGAAGGAAKYVLAAKKGLSMQFTSKWARIFCMVLGVFLIALSFGISFPLYCMFLGALITIGIISALSPHDGGFYRFR